MGVVLGLLGDVSWRGTTVVGERPRALLAALASSGGRPVRAERLIELVWGADPPANQTKSLQVLVSRTRSTCGEEAIVRDAIGYRLGLVAGEVDCDRLAMLVREARAALDQDAVRAGRLADEALELARSLQDPTDFDAGPLCDLRRGARADAGEAGAIRARALSRTGRHAEALEPLLAAFAQRPTDEPLLVDLLHTEAALRGPGAALERYEAYRRSLRERLGANPGESLQRVQRELLALDRPVRGGLRYDATPLLGRDDDLARLRALLASARVVSIVGPGGIGKTRLAHVLARDASLPVVHVVELAGVSSPQDLVGEVGSALGVRDSVGTRRALTIAQRADVRARIAQQLAESPSLLVLDNCEHLVSAVAELVAFLVSSTAEVRVLTTSRAPLAIAAEHVYLLGQLETADAVALFGQRAAAARPGVALEQTAVTAIVTRLDGLPLAIELAAAKARVMSVEEIDRRLENRFALLRGGVRGAPDRHQTLLAVIDWSWNLLGAGERRALRRLAPFNDGFTLEAAGTVLGAGALDAVQGLVDQSLLAVLERPAGLRYRMLETVREFGRMQLVEAGEDADAYATRRRWAIAYSADHVERLNGPDQVDAVDALAREEVNLSDELRAALADGDIDTAVRLLAPLAMFWSIRGEHIRLGTLAGAIAEAIGDWYPAPELEDVTRVALVLVLSNALIAGPERTLVLRSLLERLGPGDGDDIRLAGMVKVMLAFDAEDPLRLRTTLERLAADPDRGVAVAASFWLSHMLENGAEPARALAAAERALSLVREADGPWQAASLRAQLAQLGMQTGDRERAVAHAQAALPVMERLGARDDEIQLRSLLALCAISDGRLEQAEAELTRIEQIAPSAGSLIGGLAVWQIGRAELQLALGHSDEGLAGHRAAAERMRELEFPGVPRTGVEPWVLLGDATVLAAHAHHASRPEEVAYGGELLADCRRHAIAALEPGNPRLDLPVLGLLAFALGTWTILREEAPPELPAKLLALAERLAYVRMIPSMAWELTAPAIERRAPGLLERTIARYGSLETDGLLAEARSVFEQIPGSRYSLRL